MLSNKAYKMLADVLAPRIANELQCSEQFVQFMHEMIPSLIEKELGEMDEDALFELSMCVMDKFYLKTA